MAILQNTTVSGSLVVTGDLTARQYILSSSVSYFTESFASGSTRFGDSADDNMIMTGSFKVSGSTGGGFIITGSTGFVGIGTTAPSTLLHVSNSASSTTVTVTGGGGGSDWINLIRPSVSNWGINSNGAGLQFYDNTNAKSVLFLTGSGNIGIGTTAPSYLLDVNGGSATTAIRITVTGGNNLQLVKGTGPAISFLKTNATAQSWSISTDPDFRISDDTRSVTALTVASGSGVVSTNAAIAAGTYLGSNSGIYLTSGASNNAAIGSTRGGYSTTFALNLSSLLPGMNFASNNYALWITIMATNVAIQYNALVNGTVNTVNTAGSNPVTGTSWSGTAAAPILTFTSGTNQYWSAILWCCGT